MNTQRPRGIFIITGRHAPVAIGLTVLITGLASCSSWCKAPGPIPVSNTTDPAVRRGAAVFQSMGCMACHGQIRIAPPLTGVFGSRVLLADGRTVDGDEAYLRESIVEPNAKVVAGFQPVMPSFRKQLTDAQLADLVTYLKALSKAPATRAAATDGYQP